MEVSERVLFSDAANSLKLLLRIIEEGDDFEKAEYIAQAKSVMKDCQQAGKIQILKDTMEGHKLS